jgi:hypothetical protein
VKLGVSTYSEMVAVDAIVVCFQSTPNFPSWTSRVRSPSPALLFSVTYFFLPAFFTRQTVLNDVAVMLSASKYFPSVRLCTPECQRGTLAFVSASFEKWKASREVASTDSKLEKAKKNRFSSNVEG